MNKVYRFLVANGTDASALEADVALAIFTAECIYGRPRVRMEISYYIARNGTACVLLASGFAAEAAVRVFAGLLSSRIGEDGFSLDRLPRETGATIGVGA